MATSSLDSAGRESEEHDPRAVARVGTVLDAKWTLERILGSGGMGAVYAGRHRNGARGAVKILHPELARRADVRERFLREGYAANRVDHRGAVRVLDDDIVKEGPDAGTAYLVMEMLEGESLEERSMRSPPLGEAELLRYLDETLAVLEAAHANGVVHRDLKPANLFLNADPAGHGVKVLDFGLARLAEAQLVTTAGLALGTPSFMAPEQALGKQDEIDARTDLFALGASWFMLLTNRGVHEAEGVIELVARMGTMPAPKVQEVAPSASDDLARILDRALELRREDRYPSAAAMRADVLAARAAREESAGRPTREVAADETVRAVAAARGSHAERESTASAPPRRSRSVRPLAAFGLLLVLGATLLLVVPKAREAGAASLAELVRRGAGEVPVAGTATSPGALPAVAGEVAPAAPSASTGEPQDLLAAGASDAAASGASAVDAAALDAAALDAALDGGALDAGDDDEEEDEDDASALAASANADGGGAKGSAAAAGSHPGGKRPRPAPHPLKPKKKKKKRR
ncbi:MAG: Serine/threonine-protein kinase pkn3 [Labilithrix sp.]|nr:Serine/threonine-protein kinase pkn3 [Labilithrix sp.]